MFIGVPKEIKNHEYRVGLTPESVAELVAHGHNVIVQTNAGAVVVDVAIDQGGCFATSKATSHAEPTYMVGDVVHYCVANMPGAVARTSTYALNNVTLPHALALANNGWQSALSRDPHLMNGLNVAHGKVTYEAVAADLGYDFENPRNLLN